MSGLNHVWTHIESFNSSTSKYLPLPDECQLELVRSLALLPLARLDFRLDMHPLITCSDASSTGGGVCASVGLTPLGGQVAQAGLRGEVPGPSSSLRVLSIGLFDGIGGLRVALDGLGVQVLAHISVEVQKSAQMVVEANFPGVIQVNSVTEVDEAMVHRWSAQFPQFNVTWSFSAAGRLAKACQGSTLIEKGPCGMLGQTCLSMFLESGTL